ncbi:hypothetical protein ACG33_10655 [Steroidobacter denitrificans]|uniref:SnoaL-like domain-containing protein n=1 Tax=Steroidobacter denitrificans TaxID=465721 RepID=A0A127FCZ2_STEDE|nr:nuclear transport factor 2 family protein [Steroidobacter denitrificans]AMN47550.1 hypothetical protein ACG33_10655 [Steroidobacter denitrificans]
MQRRMIRGIKTPSAADVAARLAITEVLHRYCRGMDRMDRELTLSCWHPGGTDEHAPLYAGSAEGFIDWLWPVHAAMQGTRHVLSNIVIEVTGDRAVSESYWNVTLRVPRGEEVVDIFGGGRYLDQLEYINGVWAFRHRCSVHDWDRVEPVGGTMSNIAGPALIVPNNPEATIRPSARDRSDYSYTLLDRSD